MLLRVQREEKPNLRPMISWIDQLHRVPSSETAGVTNGVKIVTTR